MCERETAAGVSREQVEAALADPAFAAFRQSGVPVVVFGEQPPAVVYANIAARTLFDGDLDDLTRRLLQGGEPGALRIASLSRSLLPGAAPRLERLRFFFGPLPETITILCRRILTDGEIPVFILAAPGMRGAMPADGRTAANRTIDAADKTGADFAVPPPRLVVDTSTELPDSTNTYASTADRPEILIPQAERALHPKKKETNSPPPSSDNQAQSAVFAPQPLQLAFAAQETSAETAVGPDTPKVPKILRFAWRTNRDHVLLEIAPAFTALVGAETGDIVGHSFPDIAVSHNPDQHGHLADALASQETFSNIGLLWPLAEGAVCAPVLLGAAPVFDDNQRFSGFRGYGVVQPERLAGQMSSFSQPDSTPVTSILVQQHVSAPGLIENATEASSLAAPLPAAVLKPVIPEPETTADTVVLQEIFVAQEPPDAQFATTGAEDLSPSSASPAADTAPLPLPDTDHTEPNEALYDHAMQQSGQREQGQESGAQLALPQHSVHTEQISQPGEMIRAATGITSGDHQESGTPAGKRDNSVPSQSIDKSGTESANIAILPDHENTSPETVLDTSENLTSETGEQTGEHAQVPAVLPVPKENASTNGLSHRIIGSFGANDERKQRKIVMLYPPGPSYQPADRSSGERGELQNAPASSRTAASERPALLQRPEITTPELSPGEKNAFREIARALGIDPSHRAITRETLIPVRENPAGPVSADKNVSIAAELAIAETSVTSEAGTNSVASAHEEVLQPARNAEPVALLMYDREIDIQDTRSPETYSADEPHMKASPDPDAGMVRNDARVNKRAQALLSKDLRDQDFIGEGAFDRTSLDRDQRSDSSQSSGGRTIEDSPVIISAPKKALETLEARLRNESGSGQTQTLQPESGMDHLELLPAAQISLFASESPEPVIAAGGPQNLAGADKVEEYPDLTPALLRNGGALVDHLPVGLIVIRDGITLYANRILLELLDYPDIAALDAEGGLDRLFCGRPLAGDGITEILARDGEVLSVYARAQTVVWDGQQAMLITMRNADSVSVTAQTSALILELADRDLQLAHMRAVLNIATDGVVILDADNRILSLNQSGETLLGYKQNELAGEPFDMLIAPESQTIVMDYLHRTRNGLAGEGCEFCGKPAQGDLVPLYLTLGRLYQDVAGNNTESSDDKNQNKSICAIFQDLTARKKAEHALSEAKGDAERANALKTDFLAKISHEIRTPLNAILGFAEVIVGERFGPIGNERYREYMRDIYRSGEHVMSLVNDLLDLSKIEAGKMELAFVSVDANAIVSECVSLMQPQASRNRVVMRLSLAPGLPNIVADERSVRQIILNLLSNALKFNEAGGQVIVSTALTDSGHAVIRIKDTGIGMSESEIETALEPFRQLTSSRQSEGTGLGLPLTKALVEANRAAFVIKSQKAEGTLVEVRFPPTRVLAE